MKISVWSWRNVGSVQGKDTNVNSRKDSVWKGRWRYGGGGTTIQTCRKDSVLKGRYVWCVKIKNTNVTSRKGSVWRYER